MLIAFTSFILGIVEGLTEFLPISSTAHLTLASNALGIDQSNFVKTFEIAIQSGAIFAVILLYSKKFLDREILKRVVIAFIPTGIIGLVLYTLVKSYLIGNTAVTLSALAIGVCQSLAIIPGVSRSAATIVGGRLMGIQRETIVEFFFCSLSQHSLRPPVLIWSKISISFLRHK